MAGSARYHGQGRRRPTLSQRGRSQHAVQRAEAARADRGAADLRPRTRDGARARGRQGRAVDRRARRCGPRGDRGDRRISRSVAENPAAEARAIIAAYAGGTATDQRGALARPELVDRGPALVPSCKSGHHDLPRALRLVCRAGTAGNSPDHPTRPVQGRGLSGTIRFPAEPEDHPYRRGDLAALRLLRFRRKDRAGAGDGHGFEVEAVSRG
jgi:hypothetical protein